VSQLREIIGIDSNFFELGGHSLKAAALIAKIHQKLEVKLSLVELFKTPTIRGLAKSIERLAADKHKSIEPAEEKKYYKLSPTQLKFWLEQQRDLKSTLYNMPLFLILKGELEINHLSEAFGKLIQRHESLRTSFEIIEEEPVQKIHQEVKFEVQYYDLATENTENTEGTRGLAPLQIKNFIHSFDLSRPPLLRVGLIKTGTQEHLLMADMHHIISDLFSHQTLVQDFTALYHGSPLPPLKLQYKDFSQWKTGKRQIEENKKQEAFWLRVFAKEKTVPDLPTDYYDFESTIPGNEGNKFRFQIGAKETRELGTLALKEGATMYMMMFTVYIVFLFKLSGSEDIIVATMAAGRKHADLEKIIGAFVNTLLMRQYPNAGKTFREFLREVKEQSLTAFENQDYQVDALVARVPWLRNTRKVGFAFESTPIPPVELSGLSIEPFPFENKTTKVDLALGGGPAKNHLDLLFEYRTKLFKTGTIKRFAAYFKKIVSSIIKNFDIKLLEIEMMSNEEKRRMLTKIREEKYKNITIPGDKSDANKLEADFQF
jgi:acyl carrier protein